MSTVGELIDRTLRDYLLPPDDQPLHVVLDGDHDDATTSLTVDDSLLTGPDEDVLAPGVAVEFGTELMLITTVNSTTSLTVRRGLLGTTKAAHANNALGQVAPPYARQSLLDAVADNVVDLHPTLYRMDSTPLTVSHPLTDAPSDCIEPHEFYWLDGSRYRVATPDFFEVWPASATGKALRLATVDEGTEGYLVYRGSFARPSSVEQSLQTLGVERGWEEIVVVGAAAQAIGARDLSSAHQQYLSSQLEAELVQPGTKSDLRQSLLSLHQFKLRQARGRLAAAGHERINMDVWGRGR